MNEKIYNGTPCEQEPEDVKKLSPEDAEGEIDDDEAEAAAGGTISPARAYLELGELKAKKESEMSEMQERLERDKQELEIRHRLRI
ncbi:MAG: hypothetical protein IK093_04865 [Ruminiclostridium sp.]|nr:hypothetical protein [Ruminiclostridium sp.]